MLLQIARGLTVDMDEEDAQQYRMGGSTPHRPYIQTSFPPQHEINIHPEQASLRRRAHSPAWIGVKSCHSVEWLDSTRPRAMTLKSDLTSGTMEALRKYSSYIKHSIFGRSVL